MLFLVKNYAQTVLKTSISVYNKKIRFNTMIGRRILNVKVFWGVFVVEILHKIVYFQK